MERIVEKARKRDFVFVSIEQAHNRAVLAGCKFLPESGQTKFWLDQIQSFRFGATKNAAFDDVVLYVRISDLFRTNPILFDDRRMHSDDDHDDETEETV